MQGDTRRVRARVLEMARKDERRGDWKSALRRYRRLTGLEPDQPSLFIKLGDVCLRLGQEADAAEAFFLAGGLFSKAAFDEKAAALYRRALEAVPGRTDVRDALVEAYRRLDRTKDATAVLEQAAAHLAREGATRAALDVRRQIAGLDPLDVHARLRLAADLERCGRREEARDEYAESVLELLRQGAFERVGSVFDALLALAPRTHAASDPEDPGAVDAWVDHARDLSAHARAMGDLYRRAALLYQRAHGGA